MAVAGQIAVGLIVMEKFVVAEIVVVGQIVGDVHVWEGRKAGMAVKTEEKLGLAASHQLKSNVSTFGT